MKIDPPWKNDSEIRKIIEQLGQGRLVGGCVRDYLLYGIFVDDIDIATPLLPEEAVAKLSKMFHVIPTGLKHGTITIVGKKKYEITTLRKDEETFGRHAKVSFSATWQEDSNRRDFTINALYSDLDGKIYDFHNGLTDLKEKKVKFIGKAEDRIKEDYLRIMRFFRFAARFLNWDIDDLNACLEQKDGLKNISHERITQEWLKIAEAKGRFEIIKIMQPIFDILKFKKPELDLEKIENKEDLSALGLVSIFWQDDAALRLSNEQKKYIINLNRYPYKNIWQIIEANEIYGPKFAKDKMILENKIIDIPILPKFPLQGADLLKEGIPPGPMLGKIIKRLYKIWIRLLGKIEKEQLQKLAKKMIKKEMEINLEKTQNIKEIKQKK